MWESMRWKAHHTKFDLLLFLKCDSVNGIGSREAEYGKVAADMGTFK